MELTNARRKGFIDDLKNCIEHSDFPELFEKLFGEIRIFLGEPILKHNFENDERPKNVYSITIKRGGIRISYKYGDSHENTASRKMPSLYDVLRRVGFDYFVPESFAEFCNERVCNKDSITARNLYKKCLKTSQKLKTIFTTEEAKAMPK